MDADGYMRVVSLRKGRLKPAEFRLRSAERGLSLFARVERPSPAEIVTAVREAGKQGDLAAAIIPAAVIRDLGLTVLGTRGGTSVPAVNALHVEARPPFWRSLLVRLSGTPF